MREGLDQEGGDSHQTELWVEKFKPKSYTELLSDNGTNRTLLMWLKLWDKLVFGKERKVKILSLSLIMLLGKRKSQKQFGQIQWEIFSFSLGVFFGQYFALNQRTMGFAGKNV